MDERNDTLHVNLWWDRDLRFRCQSGRWVTEIDGNSRWAASPMQMMLNAVGSCAAVDVVDILRRGRQDPKEITVQLSGERRPDPPRRYTALTVTFHITGDVDPDKAERAVELSFEKYCSCFHSLAKDIDLEYQVKVDQDELKDVAEGESSGMAAGRGSEDGEE